MILLVGRISSCVAREGWRYREHHRLLQSEQDQAPTVKDGSQAVMRCGLVQPHVRQEDDSVILCRRHVRLKLQRLLRGRQLPAKEVQPLRRT